MSCSCLLFLSPVMFFLSYSFPVLSPPLFLSYILSFMFSFAISSFLCFSCMHCFDITQTAFQHSPKLNSSTDLLTSQRQGRHLLYAPVVWYTCYSRKYEGTVTSLRYHTILVAVRNMQFNLPFSTDRSQLAGAVNHRPFGEKARFQSPASYCGIYG